MLSGHGRADFLDARDRVARNDVANDGSGDDGGAIHPADAQTSC